MLGTSLATRAARLKPFCPFAVLNTETRSRRHKEKGIFSFLKRLQAVDEAVDAIIHSRLA